MWGSMAKGAKRCLWIVWTDRLVMKEKINIILFFFKFRIACLDSFRQHKLGKLISNAFLRGRVGEGKNLAKIIILRGTSQKVVSKRRAEMCMNLLAPVWAVNWGTRKQVSWWSEKIAFGEQDRELYVQEQMNQETAYKPLDNFVIWFKVIYYAVPCLVSFERQRQAECLTGCLKHACIKYLEHLFIFDTCIVLYINLYCYWFGFRSKLC